MQTAIYLSSALYAVGAAMYIAAAFVFGRNDLYEFFLLMRGTTAKRRRERKEALPRKQSTNEKAKTGSEGNSGADIGKAGSRESGLTGVLDGSGETSILRPGAADIKAEKKQDRIWGKPTKRFKVTVSEIVTHTGRDEERGAEG